ncbi:serine hydrolase domain-containing protein [Microscilla marina]|uniref:Beta-lactamase n=1 Tax=Microscilla marina ATCC 23134 TaxID=313606 RepID=A1ZEP1_MICM2|nr:serine hydrolase domain-containing protein [Microscilla marina]EAY30993.1 beta-lactamase [Microscilla marina ATCC 23134]
MKKLATLLLILSLFILKTQAQNKKSIIKATLLKEWNKLDTFIHRVKEVAPDFAFNAVLVWEGKIISTKRMGYANRKQQLKLDNQTIYPWASISKMFTSIAVLQLIEEGKLKIDDPVTKYVPELKVINTPYGDYEQVKIHHLINHNSGLLWQSLRDTLKAKYPKIRYVNTWKMIKPYLKYLSLSRKPGQKYEYSNGSYSILGLVVEHVTRMKFTEYIQKRIFKPLGMETTTHYGKTPQRFQNLLASSYRKTGNDSIKEIRIDRNHGIHEAHGGIRASVMDMLKFMDFLSFRKRKNCLTNYNKVLPWKIIKKYYHQVDVQKPANKYTIMFKKEEAASSRAFGFLHSQFFTNGVQFFGHTGHIGEYQSALIMRTDIPMGIILMMNTNGQLNTKEYIIANNLYKTIGRFVSRNQINLKFFDWEKAFNKLK